jgi:DNA-binding NarL/FixJ family response regulator
VKEHLASIFGKLGMDNRTAAADAAQRRRSR